MARKSTTDNNKSTGKGYRQTQWANIRLQDDDTPVILDRAEDKKELFGGLVALFDEGFDVFIKRRDDNKTVSVTITGRSIKDPNVNIGLTAFAPSLWVAISALLFKYHDVAGGQIEEFTSSGEGGIG